MTAILKAKISYSRKSFRNGKKNWWRPWQTKQCIEQPRNHKETHKENLKNEVPENTADTKLEKIEEAIRKTVYKNDRKAKRKKKTGLVRSGERKTYRRTRGQEKLWQNWLSRKTQELWQCYKTQRNKVTDLLRTAKRKFLENKIANFPKHLARHDHRRAFEVLSEVINEKFKFPKNSKDFVPTKKFAVYYSRIFQASKCDEDKSVHACEKTLLHESRKIPEENVEDQSPLQAQAKIFNFDAWLTQEKIDEQISRREKSFAQDVRVT